MYSYRNRLVEHRTCRAVLLLALGVFGLSAPAHAQKPVPIVKNMQVDARVSFDSSAAVYTYTYRVTSLPGNTGNVLSVEVDITTPYLIRDAAGDPVPEYRDAVAQILERQGKRIIPVETSAPPGWDSVNLTASGTADWGGTSVNTIRPGESLQGFIMTSRFAPGIRIVTVTPAISTWNLYPNIDDPEEVQRQQEALIKSLDFVGYTLGPTVLAGTIEHWNQLRDDLNQARQLGWFTDAALGDTLIVQFTAARTALDASDGTLAKQKLQAMLSTLAQSTPGQRRQEIVDLISLGANELIANTPNTPIPYIPRLTLEPRTAQRPLGAEHTVTATVINLGNNNKPIEGFDAPFQIVEGPHAGLSHFTRTDANGRAVFRYTGTRLGTDRVIVTQVLSFRGRSVHVASLHLPITALGSALAIMEEEILDEARVTWTGGPDLVVPLFIPPYLELEGGRTIYVNEETANVGSAPAGPSTTRYFLSSVAPPFDPRTARVLGERAVPSLAPEAMDSVQQKPLVVPTDLPAGPYYLAACADAGEIVPELDEQNNCSFSRLAAGQVLVATAIAVNSPPDCSKARAAPDTLWPPNHRLENVGIAGVIDPDGDNVTLLVTHITQDEPVNGLGDGDTSPDGFGVGTPHLKLRAERSGIGNGRVYRVSFTANDGKGGTCQGVVSVGVPHDQGKGVVPIDDGQKYDSTLL